MHFDVASSTHLNNLASCSRCGLCLDVCPTYRLRQMETESPRGRIQLLWQHELGELSAESILPHIDSCLRCGRCEPVCPTGVNVVEAVETHFKRQAEVATPGAVPKGKVVARVRFLFASVVRKVTRLLERITSA